MIWYSCWQDIRHSKKLVVAIVFVAMMLDLMLITSVEPILPSMLVNIDEANNGTSLLITSESIITNTTPSLANNASDATVYSRKASEIGMILSAKPATEMVANIFVGFIVERFGHKWPLVVGCIANLVATVGFAFSYSFYLLLMTRIVQAIGSSLSVVAGLALLACVYPNDEERVKANNFAFAGLSIGIILGFPFGSTFYQYLGQKAPFMFLAGLMFLDGALRFVVKVPDTTKVMLTKKSNVSEFFKMLLDPYIDVALLCNMLVHVGLGVMCTASPAWMMDSLKAEQWQIGLVFVVASVCQCGAQTLTAIFSVSCGKWIFCCAGLIVYGTGLLLYPLCENIWETIGPESLARIGLGVSLGVTSPLLAYLADLRHHSHYGVVYGLYCFSYNFGLVFGPVCGGQLLNIVGFDWLYRGTGVVLILFSFACVCFKNLETDSKTKDPPLYQVFHNSIRSYGSVSQRGDQDSDSGVYQDDVVIR